MKQFFRNFWRIHRFVAKDSWKQLGRKERFYLIFGSTVSILVLIVFTILAYIVLREDHKDYFQNRGVVGDTIGGISNPIIGSIVAILTFLAFYIQYKANKQQQKQFYETLDQQKKDNNDRDELWRIERFETRYFELLKMHKANVDEMTISNFCVGRGCFVPLFNELKECYILVETLSYSYPNGFILSPSQILTLAYKIYFFGITDEYEKHFVDGLTVDETTVYNQFKKFLETWRDANYININNRIIDTLLKSNIHTNNLTSPYHKFQGHLNELAHYYRHLFQTANFVVENKDLKSEEKYKYIKMLRAQLSNFEQLHLFYNAQAWFDKEWRLLFTDYRLIKNLPIPLADFAIIPEKYFEVEIAALDSKGIKMFEFHE